MKFLEEVKVEVSCNKNYKEAMKSLEQSETNSLETLSQEESVLYYYIRL
jgi:hypothetical protein